MRAKSLPILFIILIATSFGAVAQAQEEPPPPPPPPPPPSEKEWADIEKYFSPADVAGMDETEAKQTLQQVSAQQSQQRGEALADFKRGAGLGITVAPDASERIDEAFLVDNKIVVTKENTNAARMMFEFHQLFTTNVFSSKGRAAAREQLLACESNAINCPMFGIGPFMAVQMSEDDLVSSVGLGLMIGLRNDPRKETSFNFGVGLQWDSKAKQLADGFKPGQGLPTGETQIRFKEKGEARLMFGISLGF